MRRHGDSKVYKQLSSLQGLGSDVIEAKSCSDEYSVKIEFVCIFCLMSLKYQEY